MDEYDRLIRRRVSHHYEHRQVRKAPTYLLVLLVTPVSAFNQQVPI